MSELNIKFNEQDYKVDESLLQSSKNAIIALVRSSDNIGDDYVIIDGTQYCFDGSDATYKLALVLSSMSGDTPSELPAPGLYESGTIMLYREQGVEATNGRMTASWDQLLAEGVIHVENGVVYSNLDSDDTWENNSSDSLSGDLILPDDGSITALGDFTEWYDENDEYHSQGNVAFASCYNLTGVLVPSSVTKFSQYSFAYCNLLSYVNIPNNITVIDNHVFEECYGLLEIVLPVSLTSIKDDAFICCESLKEVYMPDGITSIGSGAFLGCQNLMKVSFPEDAPLAYLSDNIFDGCSSLTEINIPESVTGIGKWAFQSCGLSSIEIPENVTFFGESAFCNCVNLTNISFNGTSTQWYGIVKEGNWNLNVPANTVTCTDGIFSLIEK